MQHLLAACDVESRVKVLLALWRSWHVRNDCTHEKGNASVSASVVFLQRYWEEIGLGQCTLNDAKCKIVAVSGGQTNQCSLQESSNKWVPPVARTWKMNADASFLKDTGQSSVGIIVRNHDGAAALSVGRCVQWCSSVEEAKAMAISVGLSELRKLYRGPIAVETDCASVAALL